MSRIATIGLESQSFAAELGSIGTGSAIFGSPSISTSTVRSGAASMRANALNSGINVLSIGSGAEHNIYVRTYLNIATLPSSAQQIVSFYSSSTHLADVSLQTNGTLTLNVDGVGAIGSPSTTLSTGVWYCIETRYFSSTAASDQVEGRLNFSTFASGSGNYSTNTCNGVAIGFDNGSGTPGDAYFDDIGINDDTGSSQISWPGEGKIVLLKPTSDNARVGWTGGAAGTTNLFDAIDNTPPVGVASGSATNTSQIIDANINATDTLDVNLGGYLTAVASGGGGLTSRDTITLVEAVARGGNSGATSRLLAVQMLSNPVVAEVTGGTGTTIAATEPTGWTTIRTGVVYSPSVVFLSTQPVLRLRKGTSSSNTLMYDLAGLTVEYVSGAHKIASRSTTNGSISTVVTPATLTLTAPTGITSGDILICNVAYLASATVSLNPTCTPPTGWTQVIKTASATTTRAQMETFVKVAGGSEPGSYGFVFTSDSAGATFNAAGGITAFIDGDSTTPVNISAGAGVASGGTNFSAPSVTTTKDFTLVASFAATTNAARTFTPPTGATELWDLSTASSLSGSGALDNTLFTPAGATGTRTFVASATAGGAVQTVALSPPPPTPVPLSSAAGVSTTTLILTASTQVVLGNAATTSNATLALSAKTTIALGASTATATATLTVLAGPTLVVLNAATGVSSTTLQVSAKTQIPLGSSAATSTATLSLTAKTTIPLGASASLSSATLAVTAKTQLPLSTITGQSNTVLAITAKTQILLGSITSISIATLALKATTQVPLGTSSGISTAQLNKLTATTILALTAASATSSATLFLSARTFVTLQAATGSSTGTMFAVVPVTLLINAASGVLSASALISAKTSIQLQATNAKSGATAVISVRVLVSLSPAHGISETFFAIITPPDWYEFRILQLVIEDDHIILGTNIDNEIMLNRITLGQVIPSRYDTRVPAVFETTDRVANRSGGRVTLSTAP